MAPPSKGSVSGISVDSSKDATTRSCAPASSAVSRCNPGKGEASPRPTAPFARRTSRMYPTRSPCSLCVSRLEESSFSFVRRASLRSSPFDVSSRSEPDDDGFTVVVGSRSIGSAKRETVARATARGDDFGHRTTMSSSFSESDSDPLKDILSSPNRSPSASAASTVSATRLCNKPCCARFLAREVVTSTTLCLPSDHAASSAFLSASGVLGCACATRCASHKPRLETSGGVAKSFVNLAWSICSETGRNEKMPPPPLFTTTTVTGGWPGRSRSSKSPLASC
mmetsp:Transcript_9919/g.41633  ORF Transcript_9919/g.41633 Transcript_9919/m.41633 type:complete len:282 (+) Transcript_9919:880-1725(+)